MEIVYTILLLFSITLSLWSINILTTVMDNVTGLYHWLGRPRSGV